MVLTTFLPKGYSGDEINYIFSLSDKNINKLKNIDYIDIKDFYNIKNFNEQQERGNGNEQYG